MTSQSGGDWLRPRLGSDGCRLSAGEGDLPGVHPTAAKPHRPRTPAGARRDVTDGGCVRSAAGGELRQVARSECRVAPARRVGCDCPRADCDRTRRADGDAGRVGAAPARETGTRAAVPGACGDIYRAADSATCDAVRPATGDRAATCRRQGETGPADVGQTSGAGCRRRCRTLFPTALAVTGAPAGRQQPPSFIVVSSTWAARTRTRAPVAPATHAQRPSPRSQYLLLCVDGCVTGKRAGPERSHVRLGDKKCDIFRREGV